MENIKTNIFWLFVICILVQSTAPIFSEPLIINYDNNPNLQKAMEYDLSIDNTRFLKPDGNLDKEAFNSYLENANRELAEKYYLAYLEDINESFQRARVYNKLGNLYLGNVDQRVTSSKDVNYQKALQYYEKALAEAPEAVSFAMINVRGALTMLPDMDKSFDALKDYYEWLRSIDKQKINDSWLPIKPGNLKPSEFAIKDIMAMVDVHNETIASGLVEKAVTLGRIAVQHEYEGLEYDPRYLLQIVERFPGTKAENLAKIKISKLSDKTVENSLKDLPLSNKKNTIVKETSGNTNEVAVLKNKEENIQPPIGSTTINNNVQKKPFNIYLVAGGILLFSVMAFFSIKKAIFK